MSASTPETTAEDVHWMQQALALGALAEGVTDPNPRVGCLLVRDGRPVGSGHHRALGAPHAEAVAVARAGELARGATAYVNLEPCAHHGRTPPCAALLADHGVRRVVAALRDPNPLVDGRGFEQLRAAGVEVEVGLLADEARRLNEPFLHRHATGRPLVTIKGALSLDGLLSARDGRSRWITGPVARTFAHRLRLRHDAVLVGAGTLRRDDPRLTVRLPGVARHVQRVVLAPDLQVDPAARLFAEGVEPRPRIYAAHEVDAARERRLEGRATVVRVTRRDGRLALDEVLEDLVRCDVQALLVEGGGRTIGGFLQAGLADRVALFVAHRLFGAGGATPLVDLPSVEDPARGWRLVDVRELTLDPDRLVLGRLTRSGTAG